MKLTFLAPDFRIALIIWKAFNIPLVMHSYRQLQNFWSIQDFQGPRMHKEKGILYVDSVLEVSISGPNYLMVVHSEKPLEPLAIILRRVKNKMFPVKLDG